MNEAYYRVWADYGGQFLFTDCETVKQALRIRESYENEHEYQPDTVWITGIPFSEETLHYLYNIEEKYVNSFSL